MRMEVYPSPSGTFLKAKDGDHGIINVSILELDQCVGDMYNVDATGTDGCHIGTFFNVIVKSEEGVVFHRVENGWELLPTLSDDYPAFHRGDEQ